MEKEFFIKKKKITAYFKSKTLNANTENARLHGKSHIKSGASILSTLLTSSLLMDKKKMKAAGFWQATA